MLTLYHYWSSVCSQKARFALCEKAIEWESVHIDLFTFDHWKPDYVKMNHKAVVPTIDHDGKILTESNVIIEYLEDSFTDVPLCPKDPYQRALIRRWIYDTEEIAHPNVNTCSHNPRHAPRLAKYDREELKEMYARHPNTAIRARAINRAINGVSDEEEDFAYTILGQLLDRMEDHLADGPWLVGKEYSLADVAMASYVNRIEVLKRPEMVSAAERPRLADWWVRIQERPAFKEAFSFQNPDKNDPVAR